MKDKVINKCAPLTADFEGFSAKVYKCPAGFNTIGYGRNIEANPLSNEEASALRDGQVSKEIALLWLKEELEKCYKALDKALPFYKNLDEARQVALLDMAYNLGIKGLLGFKNTLKFVEKGDWINACINLEKSRWYKQVGRRSKKIVEIMQLGVIK
ncbi:MAG: glycoside hydrolase family protein [Helicobacteraceae bacterium]|nr:glycoside hydrolase family protein [Helicobacteraceae bacterium]